MAPRHSAPSPPKSPSALKPAEPRPTRAPDRPRWQIKALAACAALALIALVGTALTGSIRDTPGSLGAHGQTGPGGDATLRPAPAVPGPAAQTGTVWRGSSSWDRPIWPVPTRVRMPSVGVDAAVVGVEVSPSGELGIPDQPRTLGWWRQGAHPDGPGAVVIAGHVDTAKDGPGALFHLAEARIGQLVTVETNLGPRRYVVTDVQHYAKTALPALTFATTGPPHLVLITCGGVFNTFTHQYDDNIVVSANPA